LCGKSIVFVSILISCKILLAEVELPREAVVCGPNALAILLSIHGIKKDRTFFDDIECQPNGATMLLLCNAAIDAGVNAEVRKVKATELTFPAILQTSGSGESGNHYMVAYARGTSKTYVFDSTTGS